MTGCVFNAPVTKVNCYFEQRVVARVSARNNGRRQVAQLCTALSIFSSYFSHPSAPVSAASAAYLRAPRGIKLLLSFVSYGEFFARASGRRFCVALRSANL